MTAPTDKAAVAMSDDLAADLGQAIAEAVHNSGQFSSLDECEAVTLDIIRRLPALSALPPAPPSREEIDRRVLLLASYCGDDNPKCSEAFPCDDCLHMDNVVIMRGEIIENRGGFDYQRDVLDASAKPTTSAEAKGDGARTKKPGAPS